MRLPTILKRVAAVLVMVAALVNGLTAPLAHGHALMGSPTHGAPSSDAMLTAAGHEVADQADECGDHEDSQASHHDDGRSHGKAPGSMQLVCLAGGVCCASVGVPGLPVVIGSDSFDVWNTLPTTLIGLTPPVGERPPLLLHV